MLRKDVYPYEYMDDWGKFNEKLIAKNEDFNSNLNLESITDSYCIHVKRICNDFERKILGEYHDLYLKSNKSLLANVFENLKKWA